MRDTAYSSNLYQHTKTGRGSYSCALEGRLGPFAYVPELVLFLTRYEALHKVNLTTGRMMESCCLV